MVFRIHPAKIIPAPPMKFCTIGIQFAKRPIQLFHQTIIPLLLALDAIIAVSARPLSPSS